MAFRGSLLAGGEEREALTGKNIFLLPHPV